MTSKTNQSPRKRLVLFFSNVNYFMNLFSSFIIINYSLKIADLYLIQSLNQIVFTKSKNISGVIILECFHMDLIPTSR